MVEDLRSRVAFCVFGGYTQEVGDEPALCVCEPLDGTDSVIMAMPSVLANAWLNTRHAVGLLSESIQPTEVQPALPGGGQGVRVGVANESKSEAEWLSWSDLLIRYPGIDGTPLRLDPA